MRGRRVALLLTGVLPLLAKDDVPVKETNVTIDENDVEAVRITSTALHDDGLQQLPPLLFLGSNPGNTVMAYPVFDTHTMEDVLEDFVLDNINLDDDKIEVIHVAQAQSSEELSNEQASTVEETDGSAQIKEAYSQEASEIDTSETTADENTSQDSESSVLESAAEESVSDDKPVKDADSGKNANESDGDEDEEGTVERVLVDYASKSAGALILEKSPAMKGSSNLLNADNDKYAIAPCAEKKSVVIGLSEDILVKQVKIANYERYSSHLKDFQILGSQTMENWVDLGTYTAHPGLGEQVFELNESSWARYLKFRFLTHYGSEHYCTLSQIKVHGSTMLQGFKEQWEDSQEDLEDVSSSQEDSAMTDPAGTQTEPSDACGGTSIDEASVSSQADELTVSTDENDVDSQQQIEDDTSKIPVDTAMEKNVDTTKEEQSGVASSDAPADEGTVANEGASDSSIESDRSLSSNAEGSSLQGDAFGEANNETKSDNALLTFGPCSLEDTDSALLSASIKVTSHGAIMSNRTGRTEELASTAFKPNEFSIKTGISFAVKRVVIETSDASKTVKTAATVSDSVKEIQRKLNASMKGKIEKPHGVDPPDVTIDTPSNQSDGVIFPETDSVEDKGPDVASSVSDSDDISQEKISENHEACVKPSKDLPMPKKSSPEARVAKEGEEHTKIKNMEYTESNGKANKEDFDSILGSVITRFPSASCMHGLNYQDFKAKMIAARKGGTNAGGSQAPGHGGKMEPIFKTLTDEIKTLQMNQSVQEQYVKALVSCYQRVMLEMAETINDVETRQEKRLSDLEEAMDAMRTSSLTKIIVLLTTIISFCILCAGSFYAAITKFVEKLFETGAVDRNVVILIVGACMLSVLTIALYSSTGRHREQSSTSTRKEDTSKSVETSTRRKEEDTKTLDISVVVEKMSTVKHDYQLENGTEVCHHPASTSSLIVSQSLGKCPTAEPEPDLVSVD